MNATTAISNVMLGLQYFPQVAQAVMSVETSLGSSVAGPAKKQLVLSAISAAAKVGEGVPEAHVALIAALIDAIVAALNNSGIFAHAPAAAPAPAK